MDRDGALQVLVDLAPTVPGEVTTGMDEMKGAWLEVRSGSRWARVSSEGDLVTRVAVNDGFVAFESRDPDEVVSDAEVRRVLAAHVDYAVQYVRNEGIGPVHAALLFPWFEMDTAHGPVMFTGFRFSPKALLTRWRRA